MILDNPNIQRPLQLLLKEFPNYEKILSKCDNQEIIPKTDEWRYSKGDFYNPIPFRSEIDGFAPPRIIKKSYPSPDEASKNGVYASGFLNNALRVIRAPTDLPSVLSLSIYVIIVSGQCNILASTKVNVDSPILRVSPVFTSTKFQSSWKVPFIILTPFIMLVNKKIKLNN